VSLEPPPPPSPPTVPFRGFLLCPTFDLTEAFGVSTRTNVQGNAWAILHNDLLAFNKADDADREAARKPRTARHKGDGDTGVSEDEIRRYNAK